MTKDDAIESLEKATQTCDNIGEQRALDQLLRLAIAEHPTEKEKISRKMIAEIVAMRAQPEQEPYGWIDVYGHFWNHKTSEDDVPLYTTPLQREWVGLTDEQRLEMADNSAAYQVVLATEAKLKEENT